MPERRLRHPSFANTGAPHAGESPPPPSGTQSSGHLHGRAVTEAPRRMTNRSRWQTTCERWRRAVPLTRPALHLASSHWMRRRRLLLLLLLAPRAAVRPTVFGILRTDTANFMNFNSNSAISFPTCLFVTVAKEVMFSSWFVCPLATLRRNFRKHLHETFRDGWQWANKQMIKFW